MGIIRPRTDCDGAGRWAIALDPDHLLVGNRAGILYAAEVLRDAGVPHAVYRRPGHDAPWQLAGLGPWIPPRNYADAERAAEHVAELAATP